MIIIPHMCFYVDGAGSSEVSPGRYCIIYGFDRRHQVKLIEEIGNSVSGKEAEIIAIIEAMKMAKSGDVVFTDCISALKDISNLVSEPRLSPYINMVFNLKLEKEIIFRWLHRNRNPAGKALDILRKRESRRRYRQRKKLNLIVKGVST